MSALYAAQVIKEDSAEAFVVTYGDLKLHHVQYAYYIVPGGYTYEAFDRDTGAKTREETSLEGVLRRMFGGIVNYSSGGAIPMMIPCTPYDCQYGNKGLVNVKYGLEGILIEDNTVFGDEKYVMLPGYRSEVWLGSSSWNTAAMWYGYYLSGNDLVVHINEGNKCLCEVTLDSFRKTAVMRLLNPMLFKSGREWKFDYRRMREIMF